MVDNKRFTHYINTVFTFKKGLDNEGLFEKEGDKVTVESYKHALDHSGEIDLDTCRYFPPFFFFTHFLYSRNPHTICNLLKLYLQSLPEPLLTFENYNGFLSLPNEPFGFFKTM